MAAPREAGIHWLLETPWYKTNVADGSTQVRLAIADGYWPDDGGGMARNVTLYVLVRSSQRSGGVVVKEREVYPLTLQLAHGDSFTHSVGRGSAHVRAAVPYEHLRIDASFSAGRVTAKDCDGRHTRQTGKLTGSVWFHPSGSTVSALTKISKTATLIHSGSGCGLLHSPSPNLSLFNRPCLHDGVGVEGEPTDASEDLQLMATRENEGSTASFRAYITGDGTHLIVATLPASHLQVSDDLTQVVLSGKRSTKVTGRATSHADPSAGGVPAFVPSDCNGDATGVMLANSAFAGDLSVDFGFGGRRSATTGDVQARAFRERSNA